MLEKITETLRVKINFEFFVLQKKQTFFIEIDIHRDELHVSLFTSGKAEL